MAMGTRSAAKSFHRREAHGRVGGDLEFARLGVAEAGEEGCRHARQEALQQGPAVDVLVEADADGAQGAAGHPHGAVGQDQDVVGRHVEEGLDPVRTRFLLDLHGDPFPAPGQPHLAALEVGRRERFGVEIADGGQPAGIDDAADHEVPAEDANGGPAHILHADAEGRGHSLGKETRALVDPFEETAGRQGFVDTGDPGLLRRQSQQAAGARRARLPLDLDVALRLARAGHQPVARAHHAMAGEVGADVVQGRGRQFLPAGVADQDALVAGLVGGGEGEKGELLPEGGEGEDGEGEEGQRHQGQSRAQLAAPHVGDAQHEGGVGGADPVDVGPVHLGGAGLELLHVVVEAREDHGADEDGHGHDGEGQEDDGRVGDVEGRMHLGDGGPDDRHDQGGNRTAASGCRRRRRPGARRRRRPAAPGRGRTRAP